MFDIKAHGLLLSSEEQLVELASLCSPGSDESKTFDRLSRASRIPADWSKDIAIASLSDTLPSRRKVVGWLMVHEIEPGGRNVVTAHVHQDYRRRGLATAMAACVGSRLSGPDNTPPVAVMGEALGRVAKRLRWNFKAFRKVSDGWIEIGDGSAEGRDAA